ncbi:hypothetical protein Taro_034835 [Colocasia esculenta]|uniref:DUF4219 domain-containing protein n=1 Tax=Colocasia esculenta TaxID=4460 RepID=A0A843W212_COLES|nr:hypothetical protein [Colocasia esculenta]
MAAQGYAKGQSVNSPPLFDGEDYNYWKIRMKFFLQGYDYQLWSIIEDEDLIVLSSRENWTDNDSQNNKVKNIICCALTRKEFNKISACKIAKEMWDKINLTYEGSDKVNETKIDILVTQYEKFQMQSREFPTEPVTSEAHPYPHRLRPVRGRRTRIKYVIGLTSLVEVFRHSWYQSNKFEMADRRDWGGGGDDPEESTQRMIERIWESLTDIQRRMDQQAPVPPIAVPPRDGETVPIVPVLPPPGEEVPFVAPLPPPPPFLLVEEPVMQVENFLRL